MSLKVGNSGNTTKLFEANYIPFEPFDYTQGLRLKFRLPKLRKSRIIFERDEFGRIVHSKPTSALIRNKFTSKNV